MQEKCWLVEGAGVYWCGRGKDDFLPDVHEAVRFHDQVSADRILHWMLPEQYHKTCRATEHIFGWEDISTGRLPPRSMECEHGIDPMHKCNECD